MPPEDSGNHICCLIDVRGPLTERDCGAAIQRAVDRQDVLRLSILPGKERPLQMIRSSSEANFEYRELAPDQARQRVEYNRRPGIADMSAAVDRRPAHIHRDALRILRDEFAFLARHRVIQAEGMVADDHAL